MGRKDRTGDEIEEADADDATDVQHEGTMLPFSPEQAMEISVAGARLTREIALLIKREEKHVKIVTKCREDRKAKIRELIQLWEDHQKGQHRLDFPDAPKDATEHADADDGDVWSLIHGGRRVVVKKLAEGSWAAMVDGRLVGDGLSDAVSAREFVLADLGVAKQLWSSMKWVAADLADQPAMPEGTSTALSPAFTARASNDKFDVVCRVTKTAGGTWRAVVGERGGAEGVIAGDFPSKAKAQRACVKEIEVQFPGFDVPKLEWTEETAPPAADGFDVEYGARVGRKAALLRQEDGLGKWTGRIGGTPIAIGQPLDDAKRLCEAELTKGKKDVAVEWIRTETTDVTP